MKHYTQDGLTLKRTYLHQSGNICGCCEGYYHGANEEHSALEDDIECPECGKLCACKCHRKEELAA